MRNDRRCRLLRPTDFLLLFVVVRCARAIVTTTAANDNIGAYRSFNVSAKYSTSAAAAADSKAGLVTFDSAGQSVITDSDLQCLSELPVEKLLRIRKTLRYVSHMLDSGVAEPHVRMQSEIQHRYPLVEDLEPRRRSGLDGRYVGADGYAYEGVHRADGAQSAALIMDHIKKVGYASDNLSDGWVEEKPSKVQKIFQFSVTTLAFLAFGGYLLCMIVQAIKSKGTTYFHPALLPMMTAGGGVGVGTGEGLSQISQISIKRRRPVRHRRDARNETRTVEETFDGGRLAGPSPDELYNILVLAAEGYVKLNVMQ